MYIYIYIYITCVYIYIYTTNNKNNNSALYHIIVYITLHDDMLHYMILICIVAW